MIVGGLINALMNAEGTDVGKKRNAGVCILNAIVIFCASISQTVLMLTFR